MSVSTSIIIVSINSKPAVRALLGALKMHEATTTEAIVVDANSTAGTAEMISAEFPAVQVMHLTESRGFASAAKAGISKATGDVAVICDASILADVHTLSELADRVRAARSRRVAAVVPKLIGLDKTERPTVCRLPGLVGAMLGAFSPTAARAASVPSLQHVADHEYAAATCIAIDVEVLESMRGLDEGFFQFYHDADLCARLHEKQFRILFARDLTVIDTRPLDPPAHLLRIMREDMVRFFNKHKPKWQQAVLGGAIKVRSLVAKDG